VTLDSKLSFNEVSFGFVPHSGASFYLSRLPGEIGTFLALTGFPITGIDAREFGIADQLVHYSAAYEEEMAEISPRLTSLGTEAAKTDSGSRT
jgi:enoyl-CoA hydratase/carnithine racemase